MLAMPAMWNACLEDLKTPVLVTLLISVTKYLTRNHVMKRLAWITIPVKTFLGGKGSLQAAAGGQIITLHL